MILEQHSNYRTDSLTLSLPSVEGRVVYTPSSPNPLLMQWPQYYFAWIKDIHCVLPAMWCEAVPSFTHPDWYQRKCSPCSGQLHQRKCSARSFWQFERTAQAFCYPANNHKHKQKKTKQKKLVCFKLKSHIKNKKHAKEWAPRSVFGMYFMCS